MTDNVMFIPAVILMVVEALTFGFLVWAWFDAKRKSNSHNGDADKI